MKQNISILEIMAFLLMLAGAFSGCGDMGRSGGGNGQDSTVVVIDTVYADSTVYNIVERDTVIYDITRKDSTVYTITEKDSVIYSYKDSTIVKSDTVYTDPGNLIELADWRHIQPTDGGPYQIITTLISKANLMMFHYSVPETGWRIKYNTQRGPPENHTYTDTLTSDYSADDIQIEIITNGNGFKQDTTLTVEQVVLADNFEDKKKDSTMSQFFRNFDEDTLGNFPAGFTPLFGSSTADWAVVENANAGAGQYLQFVSQGTERDAVGWKQATDLEVVTRYYRDGTSIGGPAVRMPSGGAETGYATWARIGNSQMIRLHQNGSETTLIDAHVSEDVRWMIARMRINGSDIKLRLHIQEAAVTVRASQNDIVHSDTQDHNLANNQPLKFTANTMPGGLSAGTTYYVRVIQDNIFALQAAAPVDSGASDIDFTSAGSGVVLHAAGDETARTDWTYEITDATITGSGYGGIFDIFGANYYDWIGIGTGGATAPSEPVATGTTYSLSGASSNQTLATATLLSTKNIAGNASANTGSAGSLSKATWLAGSSQNGLVGSAGVAATKTVDGTSVTNTSSNGSVITLQALSGFSDQMIVSNGSLSSMQTASGASANTTGGQGFLTVEGQALSLSGVSINEFAGSATASAAMDISGKSQNSVQADARPVLKKTLTGQSASSVTANTTLVSGQRLSGGSQTTAGGQGFLTLAGQRFFLSGTSASTTDARGMLYTIKSLQGRGQHTISTSGIMEAGSTLAGTSESIIDFNARLFSLQRLAGTSNSIFEGQGNLTVLGFTRALSGTASVFADARGDLSAEKTLAGISENDLLTRGNLSKRASLKGTSQTISTAYGNVTMHVSLSGKTVTLTGGHAALHLAATLAGTSVNTSTGTATLTLGNQAWVGTVQLTNDPLYRVTLKAQPLHTVNLQHKPLFNINIKEN